MHLTSLSPSLAAVEARVHRSMLLDNRLWKGLPGQSPRFARRSADVARLWDEGPFRALCAPSPVTELGLADLRPETFWEASEGLRRPVLVRGFGADIRATRTWTADHLRARLGHHEVSVLLRRPSYYKAMVDSRSETLCMAFSEFLDRAQREPLYLSVDTRLMQLDPTLLDDLELDRVRHGVLDPSSTWDEIVAGNLFVGSPQVGSAVHCAIGGNFFFNVVGRKRWTLFHPSLSAWMHPIAAAPFQFAYSAFGGRRIGPVEGLTAPDVFGSLPRHEITLEPGDLLYNAPWWWHEVENLDPLTVGCAMRHLPAPFKAHPTWANNRLWTAFSVYPVGFGLTLVNYVAQRLGLSKRPVRAWLNALHGDRVAKALRRTA